MLCLYNIRLSIICANRIISDLPPSYEWHKRSPDPYLIIGVFALPKNRELDLGLFPD